MQQCQRLEKRLVSQTRLHYSFVGVVILEKEKEKKETQKRERERKERLFGVCDRK